MSKFLCRGRLKIKPTAEIFDMFVIDKHFEKKICGIMKILLKCSLYKLLLFTNVKIYME